MTGPARSKISKERLATQFRRSKEALFGNDPQNGGIFPFLCWFIGEYPHPK